MSTRGEKIFFFINNIVLFIIGFACLYPVLYVASASISSVGAVITGKVILFPKELTLAAYQKVFEHKGIWVGYYNALYFTIVGTIVQLVLTTCGAYPLSKKHLAGKKYIDIMVAITLWFSGGMIPTYLTFVDYGLLNTRAAIIFGFACSSMYVIIMRTFFQGIPSSLEEAAVIDGANQWQVLFQIYLPLSKAVYATIGLMYAIHRWNGYLWSMILLRDDALQPLQVVLKKIIVDTTFGAGSSGAGNMADHVAEYSSDMIVYAVIMISIVPMLLLYPFIQKYFKQGMMIGSIKG